MERRDLHRCAGLVVILVVFFLGMISGYRHVTEPGEPFVGVVIGLASVVLASLLLALGLYVYFNYPEEGTMVRVSLWTLGSALAIGALMTVLLAYFLYEGDVGTAEVNYVVFHTITVGGLAGALIGYYDTLSLRKQEELAEKNEDLEDSRRKLQAIGETSPDEIFMTDEEGRLTYASAAKERILGYSPEEAEGHSYKEFLKRSGDPALKEVFARVREGETVLNLEVDALDKNGEAVPVEINLAPLEEEGEFVGMVGVLRDLTERAEAERNLAKMNRAYRVLTEAESTMVWAEDERTLVEEICKIIVDEGGYRMAWVGFAEDNGEEKAVVPMASAGHLEGYLEEVEITWGEEEPEGEGPTGNAIRTGQPEAVQNMMTDPDYGPWREPAMERGYASSIALPMELENGVKGALNVYSSEPEAFDEEEANLLEQMADDLAYGIDSLRNRHEREERERIMQVMDRVFRHNLRNRVNVIQGYLSEAASKSSMEPCEELEKVERQVESILSHSEKAHRINQVVLGDYEPVEQDVADIAENVVSELSGSFPEKSIELEIPGQAEALAIQEIDTALQELVENALRYAGDWVSVVVEEREGSVVIQVADRGPGIPEEEIKVLTREREIEPLYHGSGLGLWLAHWIVEKSGGEIEFEENEPTGSVVRVLLEPA